MSPRRYIEITFRTGHGTGLALVPLDSQGYCLVGSLVRPDNRPVSETQAGDSICMDGELVQVVTVTHFPPRVPFSAESQ